jgi:hypothetical protein
MSKNIAIGILVLVVVALIAYMVGTRALQAPVTSQTATTTESTAGKLVARDITWTITPTEDDQYGTPHAEVSVTVEGKSYVIGTFAGQCKDIAASGSIDGKGLVAGELSAVECYWAGSGDEIGVFAHEDGGYQILVGEIGEPTAETPAFRGNFKVKVDIPA